MIGLMFFYDVELSSDQLLMRSSWLLHAGMVTFIILLIVVGLYPEYVFNRVHQALLG